jgi:hypothetical protein
MGMSASPGQTAATAAAQPGRGVIWHELECGSYRADLVLWRELATSAVASPGAAPILEVGAGTGRVALDLARRGHRVSALDINPELLAALAGRAAGLAVSTHHADAREMVLPEQHYVLCLVPMQTLQLLGGSSGRSAFLARARAHLSAGGLLACAIVSALEPFQCAEGEAGPAAETAQVGGLTYLSRATGVRVGRHSFTIERERRVLEAGSGPQDGAAVERNIVELDRLTPERLLREGAQAGLRAAGTRTIPDTDEHVGSTVVMLRA